MPSLMEDDDDCCSRTRNNVQLAVRRNTDIPGRTEENSTSSPHEPFDLFRAQSSSSTMDDKDDIYTQDDPPALHLPLDGALPNSNHTSLNSHKSKPTPSRYSIYCRPPCILKLGSLYLISALLLCTINPRLNHVAAAAADEDYFLPSSSSSGPSGPSSAFFPSTSTVHEQSTNNAAYFINGLANTIRKINSTLLIYKSLAEPFQLQFRTACTFGNLITNNRFNIGINLNGNLTYSVINKNGQQFSETVFRQVADGQWHALLFNGSRISLVSQSHVGSPSAETSGGGSSNHDRENSITGETAEHPPITVPPNQILVNLLNNPPRHQGLAFFDGFVGCAKLTTSTGQPIVSTSPAEYSQYTDQGATATAATYFQFENTAPYTPCSDTTIDLNELHVCPSPDAFILCSRCLNGARCVVLDESEELESGHGQGSSSLESGDGHPENVCACEGGYSGRWCEHAVSVSAVQETIANLTTILDSTNSDVQELLLSSNEAPIHVLNATATATATAAATASEEPAPHAEIEHVGLAESTIRPLSGRSENFTTTTTTTGPSVLADGPGSPLADPVEEEPPCPCEHSGVCVKISVPATTSSELTQPSLTCSCEGTGYYGERCEIENTFCRQNPCRHGICQPKANSYQCYCLPGFAGENCDINFDECLSSPCKNGATCLDEVNKFRCQCAAGYKGPQCDVEINECESHPCRNGGTCFDAVANYSCQCLPGYTGHSCEINIDECAPKPCQNNGSCTDLVNTFSCNCNETGYEGFYCDREIDDCIGAPCQNDGVCQDGFKSYDCACHDGYEGYDCEDDIEDCAPPAPCLNNGSCLERSNKSLYDSPPSAGLPAIFQRDFNYSSAAGFVCVCIPGYTGSNCEVDIDECAGGPCGANGKCLDGQNSFSCSCSPGYEGGLCESEINECQSNPCERGSCVDKLADFGCICPEGYGSKNCSVALTGCLNVKCFNGGTCLPSFAAGVHAFECNCLAGFAGNICQTLTTLAFDGTGYAEIKSDDDNFRRRYAMSFRFRTTLTDVLIAIGQGSTYFMLTLSGGKLNLQSSLLNNLNGISSGSNVSNAEWHQVQVFINESHTTLAVNLEQTIHPIQFEPEQPVETGFNTTVLGGATPGLSSLTNLPFFVGCIQDIKINEKRIIPGEDVETVKINTSVVTVGCKRQEQCSPNPCENGGSCSDLWQKYECKCPRPYLGGRCESEYVAATFGHEAVNLSIAVVHIPLEIGRKFEKSFEISMFVRTREPRGTIFLLTDNRRENGPFIEAYIEEDGQLGVLAKLDETKDTYKVGGLAISDGEPHLISFQKEKGLVKISVNGTEHFRKSLPLKPTQLFNPDVMFIGGIPDTSGSSTETSSTAATATATAGAGEASSSSTATILQAAAAAASGEEAPGDSSASPVTIIMPATSTTTTGPVPTFMTRTTRSVNNRMEPFKGVIQDVRVNFSEGSGHFSSSTQAASAAHVNKYVVEFFPITQVNSSYLMGDSLGQVELLGQVEKGVVSDDTCKVDPCLNGGVCAITWNDYACICTAEYDGKRCHHLLPCAIVSCPDASQCQNVQQGSGFECVAEVAFDGAGQGGGGSPHYRLRTIIGVDNLTFNEISFVYRSQRGGSILHIDDGHNRSLKIGVEPPTQIPSTELSLGSIHRSALIVIHINGNRTVEKVPKGLNGSWHSVKLALDAESNTFMLSYDGLVRSPGLSSRLEGAVGLGGNNSAGVVQARTTLSNIIVPPDFLKAMVASPSAQIIVGSFIRNGAADSYSSDSLADGAAGMEHVHSESYHDGFYRGCLSDVYIGPYRLPFVSPNQLLEINPENQSIVETTAPTAFYMEDQSSLIGVETRLHLGCVLCYDRECRNGGHCYNSVETFDCACATGFNGTVCEVNIDECGGHFCAEGSTCVDQVANYTCSCAPGYAGWLCDTEVNECDSNPCQHHGVCHDRIGSYICTCPSDYVGDNCENRKLSSCKDSPCENGATCMNSARQPDGTFFDCTCPAGFTGKSCAKMIDYCENVTCANGGTCLRKKSGLGAECLCVPGWDGPRCEKDVNECQAGPCKNGGRCSDLLNHYECECGATGFEGPTCEDDIDECSVLHYRRPPLCPTNATCRNTIGNYSCECHEDYCGPECNVPNPCNAAAGQTYNEDDEEPPAICQNGGRCVCGADDPFYKCLCEPRFKGAVCNVTDPEYGREERELSSVNIVYIIAPILAIILIGLVVASIMLVRVAKKKRATRGVYSPSQQEYCNPRVELDNVLKPPPEERLI